MARIIVGPNARFSFANVFAPNQKSGKYQVDVLISKQDTATLNALFAAYQEVSQSTTTDARFTNVSHLHPSFKHTLKDGDRFKPNDHVYAGHYFFTAKSPDRPEVVGPALEPLSSESQFYSGCYGNISIEIKAYAPSQNVPNSGYGINFKLGNIQKTKDGERLSGGAAASQEFTQTGPPSTGAPAVPGFQPVPAQAPGFPAQPAPPAWGASAAPVAPAAYPPQAPAIPQYPGPTNPYAPTTPAAPAWGTPVQPQAPAPVAPQYPSAPVNPQAPQAPWPGAAAPAPTAQPALPWEAQRTSY